jgi:hypothetical protein
VVDFLVARLLARLEALHWEPGVIYRRTLGVISSVGEGRRTWIDHVRRMMMVGSGNGFDTSVIGKARSLQYLYLRLVS